MVKIEKRLSCAGIFEHPWMKEIAPSVHLPHFSESMRAYNARRKFKGAAKAIMTTIRMSKIMGTQPE